MQKVKRLNNLTGIELNLIFRESLLLFKLVEQGATRCKIHQKIKIVLTLKREVQLTQERVAVVNHYLLFKLDVGKVLRQFKHLFREHF